MPNAQKWRPVVLLAAAAAALMIAVLRPRKPAETPRKSTRAEFEHIVSVARKLNAAAAQMLRAAPSELRPALYSTLAGINVQLALLLDRTSGMPPRELASVRQALEQARSDLAVVKEGRDPFAERTGDVVRGYVSSIGGLQGYRVHIPESYQPGRPMPLAVALHGFSNAGRWDLPPAPDYPDVITVAPRAFGPTDYKFIGERDVLDVLADVKRNYAIDDDRVYLLGSSMGGTGCWSLAVHYPDLFAGIGPIMGHSDFRVWEKNAAGPPVEGIGRLVYFQRAAASAVFLGENLANIAVYCLHGSDDSIVPVESSRRMIEAIRSAGNRNVVYWEFPGFDHGPFPWAFTSERFHWLSRAHRVREPDRVIYKTASLRYPGAYWISIEERPLQAAFSKTEASITGAAVSVTTSNVGRFRIDTPQRLLEAEEITVTVDGSIAYKGRPEAEFVFESSPEGWQRTLNTPAGLTKRPGLSGPVEDAYLSHFMIVHGSDDETAAAPLANLVTRWKLQVDFPVKVAEAVTPHDLANYNLILIGSPDTNRLMARIMPKLPVRLNGNTITCGDRTWQGADLGMKLCYPNPLNPQRYVVVLAATGYNGMLGINSRFGNWFRWVVYHNRDWFDYAVFDDRTFGPDSFLEVGFFDSSWKLGESDRWNRPADFAGPRRRVPEIPSIDAAPARFSLSSLRPAAYVTRKGFIGFDQTPDGKPIVDADGKQCKGLMMLAPASVTYVLNGRAREITFTPYVPKMEDSGNDEPVALFFAVATEKGKVYESAAVIAGKALEPVTVLLEDARRLTLQVARAGGRRWQFPAGAWLDPTITKKDD